MEGQKCKSLKGNNSVIMDLTLTSKRYALLHIIELSAKFRLIKSNENCRKSYLETKKGMDCTIFQCNNIKFGLMIVSPEVP